MSSLRKQIADLERRISILEKASNLSGDVETKTYYSVNDTYKTNDTVWERVSQKKIDPPIQNPAPDHDPIKKEKRKLNEALVGRYVVGSVNSFVFSGVPG